MMLIMGTGGGGGAAVGNPAAWSNLTLLLDEDLQVLTDVDGVYEHTDQSAAENDFTQSTGAEKPDETANGIEGDGVDDVLEGPDADLILPAAAFTIVAVATAVSATRDQGEATYYTNDVLIADAGGVVGIHFRSSDKVGLYAWDGDAKVAETDYTIGDEAVFGAYYDGSDLAILVNDGSWVTREQGNHTNAGVAYLMKGFSVNSNTAYRYLACTSDAKTQAAIEAAVAHLNNRFSVY